MTEQFHFSEQYEQMSFQERSRELHRLYSQLPLTQPDQMNDPESIVGILEADRESKRSTSEHKEKLMSQVDTLLFYAHNITGTFREIIIQEFSKSYDETRFFNGRDVDEPSELADRSDPIFRTLFNPKYSGKGGIFGSHAVDLELECLRLVKQWKVGKKFLMFDAMKQAGMGGDVVKKMIDEDEQSYINDPTSAARDISFQTFVQWENGFIENHEVLRGALTLPAPFNFDHKFTPRVKHAFGSAIGFQGQGARKLSTKSAQAPNGYNFIPSLGSDWRMVKDPNRPGHYVERVMLNGRGLNAKRLNGN